MSSVASDFSIPAPKIHKNTFLGFVWGGFTIATLFVCFRAWARYHTFRRYFMDDVFVLLALTCFLTSAILWQHVSDDMYETLDVAAGLDKEIPSNYIQASQTFFGTQIGIILLFTSTLWSIKVAFLLFFRRLGENVSGQQIHWWCAFTFTIVTWIVGIGTIQYQCLAPPVLEIAIKCSTSKAILFEHATLINNLVMDVSSDLAILSIPIRMLWKVRMGIRRKLALGGIFCLVMITMAVAIVRFAVVYGHAQPEESWLYFWNTVENTIAIIIACLASFRALFKREERHSPLPKNADDSHEPHQGFRSTKFGGLKGFPYWSGSWRTRSKTTKPSVGTKRAAHEKTSQEQILRPVQIHMRDDVELQQLESTGS